MSIRRKKRNQKEERYMRPKKERYLKCACGNIVRVLGPIKKEKCPRCEIGLCWSEEVTMQDWLRAHRIDIPKEHMGRPYLNKLKSNRGTTLCQD